MKLQHWGYVFMLFMLVAFALFNHSPSAKKEAEPALPAQIAALPPAPVATMPAPTRDGVTAVVTRVFGDLVIPDKQFVSTDLNGDGSEDLVVPVRVRAGKLPQITDRLANWSIQDVLDAEVPPPNTTTFAYPKKSAKPRVSSHESLLAVIHGYGSRGWLDPDARQAYLLVHASGGQLSTASIHDLELLGMSLPRFSANPSLALITKANDRKTAIYWTGAQYAAADAHTGSALLAQK